MWQMSFVPRMITGTITLINYSIAGSTIETIKTKKVKMCFISRRNRLSNSIRCTLLQNRSKYWKTTFQIFYSLRVERRLSFSDLSDSMQEDPHSPESDSTIYISSATPVSSRIHSFPTTPVKAPPRDLQSEILDKAAEFKAQGNACFENKKYTEAIELYSMAISYVPSDYVSFSMNVIFSLPQSQPSSLLPLAKQDCACSARFPSCHSIESTIPAGILPSGKVLFPHRRPRKCAYCVLEWPGIGLTQR